MVRHENVKRNTKPKNENLVNLVPTTHGIRPGSRNGGAHWRSLRGLQQRSSWRSCSASKKGARPRRRSYASWTTHMRPCVGKGRMRHAHERQPHRYLYWQVSSAYLALEKVHVYAYCGRSSWTLSAGRKACTSSSWQRRILWQSSLEGKLCIAGGASRSTYKRP